MALLHVTTIEVRLSSDLGWPSASCGGRAPATFTEGPGGSRAATRCSPRRPAKARGRARAGPAPGRGPHRDVPAGQPQPPGLGARRRPQPADRQAESSPPRSDLLEGLGKRLREAEDQVLAGLDEGPGSGQHSGPSCSAPPCRAPPPRSPCARPPKNASPQPARSARPYEPSARSASSQPTLTRAPSARRRVASSPPQLPPHRPTASRPFIRMTCLISEYTGHGMDKIQLVCLVEQRSSRTGGGPCPRRQRARRFGTTSAWLDRSKMRPAAEREASLDRLCEQDEGYREDEADRLRGVRAASPRSGAADELLAVEAAATTGRRGPGQPGSARVFPGELSSARRPGSARDGLRLAARLRRAGRSPRTRRRRRRVRRGVRG